MRGDVVCAISEFFSEYETEVMSYALSYRDWGIGPGHSSIIFSLFNGHHILVGRHYYGVIFYYRDMTIGLVARNGTGLKRLFKLIKLCSGQ
jgi:hypothetical protein